MNFLFSNLNLKVFIFVNLLLLLSKFEKEFLSRWFFLEKLYTMYESHHIWWHINSQQAYKTHPLLEAEGVSSWPQEARLIDLQLNLNFTYVVLDIYQLISFILKDIRKQVLTAKIKMTSHTQFYYFRRRPPFSFLHQLLRCEDDVFFSFNNNIEMKLRPLLGVIFLEYHQILH